jgi:hypothetical protein
VLGIVYRCIARHLIKKAGFSRKTAQAGAVTLIQRFGSALNIHFHMLFLDGVYVDQPNGAARFRWVKSPSSAEITRLTHTIAHRVGRVDARHPWRAPYMQRANQHGTDFDFCSSTLSAMSCCFSCSSSASLESIAEIS